MASLYDINNEILECLDPETGEIIDIEKFEGLEIEKEKKIENIALYYKNQLSDAEQYKAEKEQFYKKEKVAKNKAENAKKLLSEYLAGEKFKTTRVNISYRKSESVVIDDINQLEEECLTYKVEADKTKIKEMIKSGVEVKGAYIENKQNIQIK